MQTKTEHLMGALGALLDPNGPTVRVVQLSKTDLATLTKAADILEAVRSRFADDDDRTATDVALAMYTMQELVEAQGRVDVGNA